MSEKEQNLNCSFCLKSQHQVRKLIAGRGVYICDECIDLCSGIIREDDRPKPDGDRKIPSAKEIKSFLDQYVIGQQYAKMVIAVAVHNHYIRLDNPVINDVEIEKSNILLLGPTGSGKTLIAQSIARMLDVPFAIADATTLTEAGYVGEDVESIVLKLLQAADFDVGKAERGIIYIDEIDKKHRKGEGNSSITRDVSGEGVQQALLKIIEGTECRVPPQGGRKHPGGEMVTINTKNILFIVGGAFVGLEEVVATRRDGSGSIGFGAKLKQNQRDDNQTRELLQDIQPEDLIRFGLIPEFVGRLPVVAALEELNEDQLVQILTEPRNAVVKQYIHLLGLKKVELEFTTDALREIASICKKRKTGARGLRSVIERILIPIQYEIVDIQGRGISKIVVNPEVVRGTAEPQQIEAVKVKEAAE